MPGHKVLLLGLGFWGTKWMGVIERAGNCTLAGISGSRPDIDRLSSEYDLAGCGTFTDYREAIAKTPAEIVIIAVPTEYHADAARLALTGGMHVLSEKPLASGLNEAKEILEFRKRFPGQKYMVDQNYRWRPHNQTIKAAIDSGMIGRVGAVHFEFRQLEDMRGYREFLEMPLLQDVSIHHFDLMRFFTGQDCVRIFAYSYRPVWSRFQGKPSTEAVLQMGDGIIVNYNATWAARGRATSWDGDITVTGEKGCLKLDAADNVWLYEGKNTEGVLLDKKQMSFTELDYALDMFSRSIEEDTTPESSLEENFRSFSTVCAAEKSAAEGSPVEVRFMPDVDMAHSSPGR